MLSKSKEFLIEFFAQGLVRRGGNCASIALIKSAIGHFDKNIFNFVEQKDKFLITLRDNPNPNLISFPIQITKAEYDLANSLHGFKQQSHTSEGTEYYQYVCLSYAVMGKICQLLRKHKKYERALSDLNRGENADNIADLLGLDSFFAPVVTRNDDISSKEFDEKVYTTNHFILYSAGHAVYASEGVFDDHGEIAKYQDENYEFRYFRLPV